MLVPTNDVTRRFLCYSASKINFTLFALNDTCFMYVARLAPCQSLWPSICSSKTHLVFKANFLYYKLWNQIMRNKTIIKSISSDKLQMSMSVQLYCKQLSMAVMFAQI